MISVFVRNPEFQGQTKERLSSIDAQRLVESALRDPFDHWLAAAAARRPAPCSHFVIDRAEERLKRRKDKEVARASATRKLRLPGKLADCSGQATDGDRALHGRGRFRRRLGQAGARPRAPRRSCPCAARSSTSPPPRGDKTGGNKELADLMLALGVQGGARFREEDAALRAHHHHDRRRRRRRPHRLAADHLLLPHHAGPDPRRAGSTSPCRRSIA